MGNVRFIGCLHFGHHWMARYRGFETSRDHDKYLIEQWNSVVGKKDLTYILGDITMETDEHYYLLDKLNGRKIVVLGNHDMPKHVKKLLEHVETVAGMIDYKGCALTHCPIHPNEASFYRANIHAHIHHENKLDTVSVKYRYGDAPVTQVTVGQGFYKNVDANLVDYVPQSLQDLGIQQKEY